jgi:Tol biopolymer transport system component
LPPAPSTAFRIVINYRRDDTAGHALHLYDTLAARFGNDHVFMDIDAIEPGVDFTKVLEHAVDSCDAFISLIGRQWLTVTDAQGRRRLENPGDFVRLEIEAALDRDVRLIPVLVQEAEMPTEDELPAPLARLAYRNAIEIRDISWRSDAERLVRTLERLEREKAEKLDTDRRGIVEGESLKPPRAGRRFTRRTLLAALGAVGVVALGALLAVLFVGDGDESGDGRIVYGDGERIVAINADGGNLAPLTEAESTAPEWSPDGTLIVFAQNGSITTIDADGGGERRLTSGSPRDNAPAWSTDGTWIAFDREAGGGSTDIWVMAADGSAEHNVTEDPEETGGAPDWSPDGSRIVYQRRGQLWMMNADGSGKQEIAGDVQGTKLSPAWSPDGELIAYAVYPMGDQQSYLYVMPPDESTPPRRLTADRLFSVNYPAWSADGERLVFTAQGGLWMVARGGGAVKDVPSGPRVESPSWAAAD